MTYLTVKEVAEAYRFSLSALYRLSREDPSFPAFNIGHKKKIVIDANKLKIWIKERNVREEILRLPSNTIIFRRRKHEIK